MKLFALALILMLTGSSGALRAEEMQLTSPAFQESAFIPEAHTCDGADISPALRWTSPPPKTQSLALLVDDPDAPGGVKSHWVLFNLPPSIRNLPGSIPPIRGLANMERNGTNDFNVLGFRGPCPPSGETHRYIFKLHALDNAPGLDAGAKRAQILEAMQGHILAATELTGKYSRKK
jgi:Raf kinase inhibitor-like YbhB/YbcL family protein